MQHIAMANTLMGHDKICGFPYCGSEELAVFLSLQRRSVHCSLYALHQLGCLEPITTKVGKRWHLCGRGLRLISATNHMDIRNIAVISDDEADRETSTMRQRDEAWLLQHMQHTTGIYGFFASLTQAARQEPGRALCWWETGAMCERRYQVHEQWFNFRPDSLAEYRVGPQQLRFCLEWDRGTINVRDRRSSSPRTHTISPRVNGHESVGCFQC
jgi:hypothetical protein